MILLTVHSPNLYNLPWIAYIYLAISAGLFFVSYIYTHYHFRTLETPLARIPRTLFIVACLTSPFNVALDRPNANTTINRPLHYFLLLTVILSVGVLLFTHYTIDVFTNRLWCYSDPYFNYRNMNYGLCPFPDADKFHGFAMCASPHVNCLDTPTSTLFDRELHWLQQWIAVLLGIYVEGVYSSYMYYTILLRKKTF